MTSMQGEEVAHAYQEFGQLTDNGLTRNSCLHHRGGGQRDCQLAYVS